MSRLGLLLAMNADFAKAYHRGETWAVKRAQQVAELDNPTRNFPERSRHEDGLMRNHCGSCPYRDGCVVCDLPYDPSMKGMIGILALYRVTCEHCGFSGIFESASEEDVQTNVDVGWRHRQHSAKCPNYNLNVKVERDPRAADNQK